MSMTDGYLDLDLGQMDAGVREASGLTGDGKYLRQRDELNKFGKSIAFKILPMSPEALAYYRTRTFPFAAVPHGWFTHPFKKIVDGDGEKTHRFFHVSPKALGGVDKVQNWLQETLHDLPGYMGGSDADTDEAVRIFQSLYTSKDPRYRHIGGPTKKQFPKIMEQMKAAYPKASEEELKAMANRVRQTWQIYKMKFFMPIVQVQMELNEAGQSVPMTNGPQILDFENTLKQALFNETTGLFARNKAITDAALAQAQGQPFQAHRQAVALSGEQPTYDIIIQCFENRQFVANNPNKDGYNDFRAFFRTTPTLLESAGDYYAEDKRVNILKEVERGILPEEKIIDCFKAHFGYISREEFEAKHPEGEEDQTTDNPAAKAEALAEEANAGTQDKADTAAESAGQPDVDEEAVTKVVGAIEGMEGMGIPVPEALLIKYKELTGKDYGTEGAEEAAPPEEPKKTTRKTSTKKTTTGKKTTGGRRKTADV